MSSVFLRHEGCNKCGSSDGNSVYEDEDGLLSYHCFSCKFTVPSASYKENDTRVKPSSKSNKAKEKEVTMSKANISDDQVNEVKDRTSPKGNDYRGISNEITKFFGVRTEYDESTAEVIARYYPVTKGGVLGGYKVREAPKNFYAIGSTGNDCDLFGSFRFKSGGKYVLIVGGEEDAMAAYQMFKSYSDSKNMDFVTAVVSVTVGEANASKQIATNYEFLNSFDNIIVGFDNDEVGRKGAEKIIPSLPRGKIRIASWGKGKDPNQMLEEGNSKAFLSDFYSAKSYVPAGVLGSGELYERIMQQTSVQKVPFPPFMKKLNEMLVDGIPLGHIINIAASTGLGKCFAKGTKVRMFDMSTKSVENIIDGDKVMGDDGTARVVKGVTSGIDKMYRITQVKGMGYTVNSAHILSLRASTDIKGLKLLKGDILNINVEDYLLLSKTTQNRLKGYKADISGYGEYEVNHAYLIGLWLGDGTSAKPQITFGKTETELLDWFESYCKWMEWSIGLSPSNDREGCVTYDLNGFRAVLKQHNLLNNKHIPSEIMQSSLSARLEVLAGIIDADGYLSGNCYTLTMKDNQLAQDIILLARSVGLAVTESRVFKKCQNFTGAYYVGITISGHINKVPVKLLKRKASARKQIKNVLNTGITVTELSSGEYFGFQVDGNHLFCLEDFTVTHNTTLINELIYFWIFNSPHMIGVVSMELGAGQYGEVLLSRHIGRKLALMNTEEKLTLLKSDHIVGRSDELFKTPDGGDRFMLVEDREGSLAALQSVIEELVISSNCKVIVIDPLQDILDGLSNEDQSIFMKWAKGLIKSHNISFIYINHMRKTAAGQEDKQTENDIHGSSTITKSASVNILLSRNKYSESEDERNTTKIMLSKNRLAGLTGPAGELYYCNAEHTLYDKEEYFSTHSPSF